MQNRIIAIGLVISTTAFAGLTARSPLGDAQSLRTDSHAISFCVDSNGFASNAIAEFRTVATTTDAGRVTLRTRASLLSTSTDSVQLVTVSAVCLRAAQSIRRSRFQADTGPLSSVLLLQYGSTRYVGFDGTKVGEWALWTVFDTSFAKIGNYTW